MTTTLTADEPDGVGDAELVTRLRVDPDALELFYRRHVTEVAAFVARRVRDADSVADVVSNTFLAAIKGSAGFDPTRHADTARFWLFGIARRQIADHYGAADRQSELTRRAHSTRHLSDDETARIDELIDAQRLAPDIQSALDRLSAPVRDAFVLVTLDGVPQSAAAEVLGISHAALRARLTRARIHLRRHLRTNAQLRLGRTALALLQLHGGSHGI